MERNVTYLTEEEIERIVEGAFTDWAKNNLVHPLKQGWDAYKNAQQQNKQNGMGATKGAVNAIKAGAGATANAIGQNVDAADQANYNSRTYNADGTIKKPGFFDGTFTAIADYATGGKWSKVRNGVAKYNIQKAYSNPNNNGLNKYEQRLFDFWTQNVKGQFRDSRDETAGQTAVRMWNEWYETQTNSTINNKALDEYIDTCIQTGKKVSQMSYPDFLEFCKLNSYNSQDRQQNESLQRLLRKNLMQLI